MFDFQHSVSTTCLGDLKAAHQFLARFHGEVRPHPTEHFFTAFRIHRRELAHQFVARFPFRILAQANANREKPGDDPDRNVC